MANHRLDWRDMLPIVTRELRVASKRRSTYRVRLLVALVGAATLFICGLIPGTSVELGRNLFWATAAVMLVAASVAGLALTADSISKEKRDETLGLLFLTRLAGADVVLGKLSVGALSGFSIAFAALPFLAFSLCLGGVTGREFWTMSGALFFALGYSLALGIFVSALFRRESAVSMAFCLGMFLPLALVPFALMKWTALPKALAMVNPLFPALALMDGAGGIFPAEFARSALVFQFAAVVGMIAVACVVWPRTVRARVANLGRPGEWRPRAYRRLRVAERRAALEANPVLWLSQRRSHPLILLGLCAGLWLVVGFASSAPFETEVTYVVLMAIAPKLFVLWHSSGLMAAERQFGFLEALLTTPLSAGEVLQGKMRAIKRQIFPALIFALLIQWLMVSKWWAAKGQIPAESTLLLAGMITLLIDVHTVAWIGMWQGLVAPDRRKALIRATIWGFLAPWLPPTVLALLFIYIFEPRAVEPVLVGVPVLIAANVFSIGLACWAMARLHERFRSTATQTWSRVGG